MFIRKQPSEGFFLKSALCEISQSSQENIYAGTPVFSVNFAKAKFVRTHFLQNTTGWLLLIIAVSIVVKGELAKEIVNYDTKTKAYEIKQSPRGAPWKRWSWKFHKIHRKIPGPACNFIKQEALAQVFFCEFCQIYKNTFSYRKPLAAPSVCTNLSQKRKLFKKGSPGEIWTGFRSSRSQIFFKIGILNNFANSTETLFDKVTILKALY